MFNYDDDSYNDDERFYEQTAYNEVYYIEQEQDLIRESNLEIELDDEATRRGGGARAAQGREEFEKNHPEEDADDLPF